MYRMLSRRRILKFHQCWRFKSSSSPIIPKTSKAEAVTAEATRRKEEVELRKKRLYRFTPEGQKELNLLLGPIREEILVQGQLVRSLKEKKSDGDLTKEVSKLKKLRRTLEKTEAELTAEEDEIDYKKISSTIKNHFFYSQSATLYGGSGGFIDFGPYGTKLKQNIISEWRKFFLSNENCHEIESSMITHSRVFDASGHTKKFTDLVVKDLVNGECFRADKLIISHIESKINSKKTSKAKKIELEEKLKLVESLNKEETFDLINELGIKSTSGNELSRPIEFNLMFQCDIGPEGKTVGYLRPETAQGIFSNFKLLRNNRLPFAVGQVGHSFRNEISTGNGLIRTREFQMAEIEHFFDPQNDDFEDFQPEMTNLVIPIWTEKAQMSGQALSAIPISDINMGESAGDQILNYYLFKLFQFCESIGIDTSKLRFREQLTDELAHYATVCYDLECRTNIGWVECAGLANRTDYDLRKHSEASGQMLSCQRLLPHPIRTEQITAEVKTDFLKTISKKKKQQFKMKKFIEDYLKELPSELLKTEEAFPVVLPEGEILLVPREALELQYEEIETVHESFIPHVIEPSIGINRLVQVVLEHCFRLRLADGRKFFTFPPSIAPIKCSVLTIRDVKNKPEMGQMAKEIKESLINRNISIETNLGGDIIGRKYLKSDEVGTPFALVVDDQSVDSKTVTIRDRDTLQQKRIPQSDIPDVITKLVTENITFDELNYSSQEEFLSLHSE